MYRYFYACTLHYISEANILLVTSVVVLETGLGLQTTFKGLGLVSESTAFVLGLSVSDL